MLAGGVIAYLRDPGSPYLATLGALALAMALALGAGASGIGAGAGTVSGALRLFVDPFGRPLLGSATLAGSSVVSRTGSWVSRSWVCSRAVNPTGSETMSIHCLIYFNKR